MIEDNLAVRIVYWQKRTEIWFCWAYPNDDKSFEQWMKKYCPTADVIHRFNSGNPMYTVAIQDDKEATLFQLKWG